VSVRLHLKRLLIWKASKYPYENALVLSCYSKVRVLSRELEEKSLPPWWETHGFVGIGLNFTSESLTIIKFESEELAELRCCPSFGFSFIEITVLAKDSFRVSLSTKKSCLHPSVHNAHSPWKLSPWCKKAQLLSNLVTESKELPFSVRTSWIKYDFNQKRHHERYRKLSNNKIT